MKQKNLAASVAAVLLLSGSPVLANSAKAGTDAVKFEDVETLMDNIAKHDHAKVSVKGEVKDLITPGAFVLESGGIFDDEIVVVLPKQIRDANVNKIREDADLVVNGTIRRVPVVTIQREIGWDFDPQVKVELDRTNNYLVAESVARQLD